VIVSCGEALVDLVPEAVPGGGPMNVAVAAVRMGAPSAFVGRVSTDEHGQLIWRHLESNGVELQACERGDEPTARAIVRHVPQLVFEFEGDDTADTMLSRVELAELGDGPHLLHGGTLGFFRGRTAEVLAAAVERHDGIVSLDPNVRPDIVDDRDRWDHFHQRWLAHTHIYKASEEDLAWVWPDQDAASAATRLLEGAVEAVFVTRGPDGVSVFTRDGRIDVSSPRVQVADTVGAGDTFAASVLVSLHDRLDGAAPANLAAVSTADWTGIAHRAAAAAAVNCSRVGADPPTRAELDAFLG
jgi:fructokinase